jgi:hypothetical protein
MSKGASALVPFDLFEAKMMGWHFASIAENNKPFYSCFQYPPVILHFL